MPRLVDHQQRRHQIADSVVRMAAENGIEAVTLARAAEAAGVSKGMLQYYFSTRQELIRNAAQVINDRTFSSIEETLRSSAEEAPRQRLLALLACLTFPSPAQAYDNLALRALFVVAVTDPMLNLKYRQGRRSLLELFETQLSLHWSAESASTDPHRAQAAARFIYGSLQEIGEALAIGELTPCGLPTELERLVDYACQWSQLPAVKRQPHETDCLDCTL